MKNFDNVIQKYKNSRKLFLDLMEDDIFSNVEKNVFKKEIETYDEFIEDLESLQQIHESSESNGFYANDKSAIKYNIENAKADIWKLREDSMNTRYPMERDEVISRIIDLLYSLADVVSREDK